MVQSNLFDNLDMLFTKVAVLCCDYQHSTKHHWNEMSVVKYIEFHIESGVKWFLIQSVAKE